MSPTEDDLRRALSDGAGDVPDTDYIVFAARERRTRRRQRVLSVATAVVVVGGVATGGTLLVRNSSSSEAGGNGNGGGGTQASSRSTATRPAAAGGAVAGSSAGTVEPSAGTAEPFASCPARVPGTASHGTVGAGATGDLFAKPVATLTVCAYPTGAGGRSRLALSGSAARTLAASLENASRSRPTQACPDYRMADQKALAIVATTADGTTLPTVTASINEPACAIVVTNGTAVRYHWSWPSALASQLAELSGGGSDTSGSPPGTPVH